MRAELSKTNDLSNWPTVTETHGLDSAPDVYHRQLQESKLVDVGALSCWVVQGTNTQNAYSTHGIFRFFGKFPPPIGRKLIEEYSNIGDLVIDPMCGSGTTGVECVLHNRIGLQYDVNPVSISVSKAKTTHLSADLATKELERIVSEAKPASFDQYPVKPEGLRNPDHWFLPETSDSLRGIHRAIQSIDSFNLRRLFFVCFLGTIRRVSRATTQQGRLFLDAATALEDAVPTFERTSRRTIQAIDSFPAGKTVPTSIHDAREPLPTSAKAKLCILHPPYFNSYKYSRVNSLELAWSGTLPSIVRKSEVREFFKIGKPENVSKYVEDMARVLDNLAENIAPDGVLAVMVGDTKIKGIHIPVVHDLISHVIDRRMFDIERVILRVPRHTEASWVASQRRKAGDLGISLCDYILVFRRTSK